MTDWGPILDALATGPRENGTPGLEAAIDWLLTTLNGWGIAAHAEEWTAHPYRLRLAGLLIMYVIYYLINTRQYLHRSE